MPARRTRTGLGVVASVVAAFVLGGCGLGGGSGTTNASVSVTENFGSKQLATVTQKKVPGQETVMQLMERNFKVSTSYGGGFVDSINGASGSSARNSWFYYVNGIQAPKGAATTKVFAGDQVLWDLHNWTATDSIPAIVGSYPEPFTNGVAGQKYPTLLTCAPGLTKACDTVADSLHKAGVKVSFQGFGTGSGSDSFAIVVGTFKQIQGVIAAELIKAGPKQSGVYAQNVGNSALELDDPLGDVVQTLHGNAGLIAATEQPSLNQPAWMVTGTTAAGVDAAAAALTPAKLHDHFAVAISDGRVVPVPILDK
jgi:Domain of unknown function (DUF4430)